MSKVQRGRCNYLFETSNCRVWSIAPNRLAMYDKDDETQWIAAESPVNLRDWR